MTQRRGSRYGVGFSGSCCTSHSDHAARVSQGLPLEIRVIRQQRPNDEANGMARRWRDSQGIPTRREASRTERHSRAIEIRRAFDCGRARASERSTAEVNHAISPVRVPQARVAGNRRVKGFSPSPTMDVVSAWRSRSKLARHEDRLSDSTEGGFFGGLVPISGQLVIGGRCLGRARSWLFTTAMRKRRLGQRHSTGVRCEAYRLRPRRRQRHQKRRANPVGGANTPNGIGRPRGSKQPA